jgi:uncharacterized protein involved in exopolysaccharide biosynthesis
MPMPYNSLVMQDGGSFRTLQPVQDGGSVRPIVESAFRYQKLWWLVVLSIVLLTVVYTALAPREYRSEMDILVQNKRGDAQISPDRVNGEITVNGVTEEEINSEIEILTSRGLANEVVDPRWNQPGYQASLSQQQMKAHDKAVVQFQKHLSIALVRKSNMIHATFSASDPAIAKHNLDSLLAAFLEKQRDIAQPPGTAKFFADQAANYKRDLDAAQQELAKYQQQQNIVSLQDTEQALDRSINDAQAELRMTDAQLGSIQKQLGAQTRQLKSLPNRQMTQVRTLPNDYSVERLNTMLAELQNQRTSLLTKFTPQDRMVQQVERQIADTKAALKNAEAMTSQEHDSDVNPVWQSVTGSIIQNETQRESLKAKRTVLADQIVKMQKQLADVEGSTVPFMTLKQRVTDLQSNFQLYTQKRDEAQIADAMNQNRLLNVAVAQNPTFSILPYRPKPVVDIVLGTFTALFIASFLVFFAEMGRSTFASAPEVEKISRYPVLATVPLNRSLRGKKSERLPDFAPVFIGMTAAPQSGGGDRKVNAPSIIRYRRDSQI